MPAKKAVKSKKSVKKVVDPFPVCNNFKVELPAYPDLGQEVVSFNYDLCQKTFTISLKENVNLDVFDWANTIDEKHDAARLHNHMATQDMLIFTVLDQNDNEVATLRFAKLILRHHTINFNKGIYDVPMVTNPVCHTLTLSFERCEKDKNE